MSNAWNEFLFNAVQAIAPFITRLVEGTTSMIQFLDSIDAAPVLGWSIVALAAAAALGTLGIAGTTVVRGLLALRTAQMAVTGVFSTGTAATAANTASLLANTRSVGANTASRLAAVTSMNSFTIASNAATAGMARFTAAASAAGAAVRTFGSVLGSLAGFGALLAGVSALVLAYQDFARAADSSSESVVRANRQYLEAAGGSKALQDALAADTAAYRAARTRRSSRSTPWTTPPTPTPSRLRPSWSTHASVYSATGRVSSPIVKHSSPLRTSPGHRKPSLGSFGSRVTVLGVRLMPWRSWSKPPAMRLTLPWVCSTLRNVSVMRP